MSTILAGVSLTSDLVHEAGHEVHDGWVTLGVVYLFQNVVNLSYLQVVAGLVNAWCDIFQKIIDNGWVDWFLCNYWGAWMGFDLVIAFAGAFEIVELAAESFHEERLEWFHLGQVCRL
jgi:hypothetical protein